MLFRSIPAERMKMRRPHDVPLSRQALAVLKIVWPLNEENELVFPSLRSHKKPLSENAFNSVLRNMGYSKDQATAHGFRSTASTILNERGSNGDVIEAALAHQDDDEVRRIYNRALYLPERKKLMQDWADLMDSFKKQKVVRRAAYRPVPLATLMLHSSAAGSSWSTSEAAIAITSAPRPATLSRQCPCIPAI